MASSPSPDSASLRALGAFLTGTEAKDIADRLADDDTLTAALRSVDAGRRVHARDLLGNLVSAQAIPVLRAIEGAHSQVTAIDPLWTMPGHLAGSGALTASARHLVEGARQSVTCSTYNFQRSSGLWQALQHAAHRPQTVVRVYVDTRAADHASWSPSTGEVARHLHPATVLRTVSFDGVPVRNHAKFLAIDHRFLLVTSANFSFSAEHGNVELGVLVDNAKLTESVEREIRDAEPALYERVPSHA